MNKDNKLSNIIKKKNFKNFWCCFDYLIMAGYSDTEALEIAINEFDENSIFSDVGFIRLDIIKKDLILLYEDVMKFGHVLKVGFVNTSELTRLFDIYRKVSMLDYNLGSYAELEEMCEFLCFKNLSHITLKTLLDLSKKHYGYEAFKLIIDTPAISDALQLAYNNNIIDMQQRINNEIGIPPHLLGRNNTRII